MNGELFQDVFSAHLDAEATPEERAEVEGRLAVSGEIRRFLDDLRQVGDEIRALPQERLPAYFAERVLAGIEREMLLPTAPAEGPRTKTSRLNRRIRNFAALAVTAAALMLTLSLLNPEPPQSRPGRESVVSRLPSDPNAFAEATPADTARRKPAMLAARKTHPFGNNEIAGGAAPEAEYREPLVPPIIVGQWRAKESLGGGLLFFDDLQKLTKDDVGRVVTAMEQSDSGIAIVKLTVVDCRDGLNELQVLLADHRIRRKSSGPTFGDASGKPVEATGRLTAVYVRSTSDRLASAVADLKTRRQFRRLEVDAPISPSRLDVVTRNKLALLDSPQAVNGGAARYRGAVRPQSNGPQPAKRDGGSAKGKAGRARKNAAQQIPGDNVADGRKAPRTALDRYRRISQQLQLTMPANSLRRDSRELAAARDALRRRIHLTRSLTQRRSGGPAGKVGSVQRRPVRVLFVLECPTPPKPGASRPTGAAPAKPAAPQG
ncbi:MAG: anti-sigma factor family protein [Planctomycetaceae bacterium]